MSRAGITAIGALVLLVATTAPAQAYEFEIRAFTIGQGYQLRLFRPTRDDDLLNRRRFTQTLTLNVWNIGREPKRLRYDTVLDKGPSFYVSSYIRIDHDFGDYSSGEVRVGSEVFDAVDIVPELEVASLGLDVLFAYGGVRGLGGMVDIELGRQLVVDTLEWWSFDGVTARVHTPWLFSVEGFGGFRVRDSSPAGSSVQEPDGTAGAECAEYQEGPTPGSGSWRPIDREIPGANNPFESDFDICPQRDEIMPTFGGTIETADKPLKARLSYRRSVSRTPGIIGGVNDLDEPDVGFYPDEFGQAPKWGVNEERISLSLRYTHQLSRGKGRVVPFGAGRYSLLHGIADEAHGGVRFVWGPHTVSPEYYYSFPTFDGDSIFNVFSTQPYHDLRMSYQLAPRSSTLSGFARGWARRYAVESEDADRVVDDMGNTVGMDSTDTAAGIQLGGKWKPGKASYLRLDLFHEDGYGGRRTGGYGVVRWRVDDQWDVATRVSLIDFDEDLLDELHGTTVGGQLGATYRVAPGIGLHLTAEQNTNRFHSSQLRVIGILDLAFHPET